MGPDPHFPVDLVKFTEEILNGKFHFLCSVTTLFHYRNPAYNPVTFPSSFNIFGNIVATPWIEGINWTYIIRSEDV